MNTNSQNDLETRKAVIALSEKCGKPILKLTDEDYRNSGLNHLVEEFGSSYSINVKVFNHLQHTITGWPGGKPGEDDTFRPERATPAKKRVVVFSPHPDDDVISMGGTLQRLVEQGHEVHVAYETSGNIAVGDEDMMRYIMLMDSIAPELGFDSESYIDKSNQIRNFIQQKQDGQSDSDIIRLIKTKIRQGEARLACRYVGVPKENIHFLNLPFYETGTIKKGDLTSADVDIVQNLLDTVKPHMIFVAGDLADPHGTHRTCTVAVLSALESMKGESWLNECNVWMYRGAWAEWPIEESEMAVPMSPAELKSKRKAILKHQSQMENAPFLGDDDRLFWQRAEDRNRDTATKYDHLGLTSYEAIEAFVRWKGEKI